MQKQLKPLRRNPKQRSPWLLSSHSPNNMQVFLLTPLLLLRPPVCTHLAGDTRLCAFTCPNGWQFTAPAVSLTISSPVTTHFLALCWPKCWQFTAFFPLAPTQSSTCSSKPSSLHQMCSPTFPSRWMVMREGFCPFLHFHCSSRLRAPGCNSSLTKGRQEILTGVWVRLSQMVACDTSNSWTLTL